MLSSKQAISITEATKRISIWVGAVRSGKTYSSILKLCDLLKNGPPGDVMLIGVNRSTIQRNVLTELYKFLGFPLPSSKSMETKLYGRNVYFVGAHDEGAVRGIQGATLAFAYVDECACIPHPFWKMLLSRLSVPGAQLLATCNPEGPAHWLKKEYIDRRDELDLVYWNFTLDDNPALDPKYKENLKKEYTGIFYKRFILGEWAAATGIIYDTFDEDNIYTHAQDNPDYYIAGVDYGTVNPTCCLIAAVSPRRWPQIRIESEYYYNPAKAGRSKVDAELADDIYNFLKNYPVRAVYVDPAAASLKLELRNRNIPVVDAKNDVLPGIQIVSKFIHGKNLVVHKGCKNLIEQIQSYQWSPKAADRGVDEPIKKDDHACFIGETIITTQTGYKKIKDIKTGEYVLTRKGYRKVVEVISYPTSEIIESKIGKITLIGTPNHPVYAEKRWIPLNSLKGYNKVLYDQGYEEWKTLNPLFLMDLPIEGIPSQKMQVIEFITDVICMGWKKIKDICIGISGNFITEKFQKSTIFTISTETQKTTKLKTLNACLLNNTLLNILAKIKKKIKNTWKKFAFWLQNGTVPKLVDNGIKHMRITWHRILKKKNLFVSVVVKSFQQNHLGKFCFAGTTVKQNGAICQELTTSKENAKNAKRFSLSTNIRKKDFALHAEKKGLKKLRLLNVYCAIKKKSLSDTQEKSFAQNHVQENITVYNLKIEDAPEYFANGVLVHNCDAARYLCASGFPNGDFGSPDEHLTIDEYKRRIYDNNPMEEFSMGSYGYY